MKNKTFKAYIAFNYSNPWEHTARRTKRDCIAAVKADLLNPERDIKGFTIKKVIIKPINE